MLSATAAATAAVEYFFTISAEPDGPLDRDLSFKATNGNQTDYADGYALAGVPGPNMPLGDAIVDCTKGEWAHVSGRFGADEPAGALIQGISIEIVGANAGIDNIAWYKQDNLLDLNLWEQFKRWDGETNVFYFNPAGLIRVTSYGVPNTPENNAMTAGNMQYWDEPSDTVTFLLGTARCATCPGELTCEPRTRATYATAPNPEIALLNKAVCVPEPMSLLLLAILGTALRRR